MMSTARPSSTRLGFRIEQAKYQLALPDGARRLISSGDVDGRDNQALVTWLMAQPELAERLLRWCNTPLYNLSRPFDSLQEASGVMDGRELARLAVLAWTRGMFLPDHEIDVYSRERLWVHSIAVGAVASLISRTCSVGDSSLVFVAGALHDIGIISHERLDAEGFAEVVAEVDQLSPLHEIEQEILGWDHCQFGRAVLEQWGMPEEVQMAAAHHHQAHRQLDQPHGTTVACVAVANFLCSRSGWASTETQAIVAPSESVFEHLGIDSGILTVLWQQLYPALDSVSELR